MSHNFCLFISTGHIKGRRNSKKTRGYGSEDISKLGVTCCTWCVGYRGKQTPQKHRATEKSVGSSSCPKAGSAVPCLSWHCLSRQLLKVSKGGVVHPLYPSVITLSQYYVFLSIDLLPWRCDYPLESRLYLFRSHRHSMLLILSTFHDVPLLHPLHPPQKKWKKKKKRKGSFCT